MRSGCHMRDGPALGLACLGAGPRRPGRELGPFECQKNKIIVEEKLEETQNEVSFNQLLNRSATLRSRGPTAQAQHENGRLRANMSPSGGACTGLPVHPSHCCSPSSMEESAMLQQSQHAVRTLETKHPNLRNPSERNTAHFAAKAR